MMKSSISMAFEDLKKKYGTKKAKEIQMLYAEYKTEIARLNAIIITLNEKIKTADYIIEYNRKVIHDLRMEKVINLGKNNFSSSESKPGDLPVAKKSGKNDNKSRWDLLEL